MATGEIGQIAGLWAGIGISLGLSIKALRQTRQLQSREHRLKLLDEVRDWAGGIAAVSPLEPKIGTKEELVQYLAFNTKSEYVREIAKTFGDELVSAADYVIFNIRIGGRIVFDLLQLRDIEVELLKTDPWLGSNEYISKAVSTLPDVRYAIRKSAIELMKVTARTKSRNV
jgi:hypothetical protein